MLNLKPCPFCSGKAELAVVSYQAEDRYRVYCPNCGVTTWPRIVTPKLAEKVWNRRVKT